MSCQSICHIGFHLLNSVDLNYKLILIHKFIRISWEVPLLLLPWKVPIVTKTFMNVYCQYTISHSFLLGRVCLNYFNWSDIHRLPLFVLFSKRKRSRTKAFTVSIMSLLLRASFPDLLHHSYQFTSLEKSNPSFVMHYLL